MLNGQVKVGRSSCAGSVLLHFQQTNSLVNDNLLFTDPGKNNKTRPLTKLAILLKYATPVRGRGQIQTAHAHEALLPSCSGVVSNPFHLL